jgi:outer membrane protein TolC
VWDWGTTISGIHEADAKRQQAELARTKLEDQVRLEARQLSVDAGTAKEALAVARVAVAQAEENYRIVTKRFENSASSSFDLVDAEALLTQARAQVESALYGYLVARAALQRATGALLPRVR